MFTSTVRTEVWAELGNRKEDADFACFHNIADRLLDVLLGLDYEIELNPFAMLLCRLYGCSRGIFCLHFITLGRLKHVFLLYQNSFPQIVRVGR